MSLRPRKPKKTGRIIYLSANKIRREQRKGVRQQLTEALKEAEREQKGWDRVAKDFGRDPSSKKLAKICRRNAANWRKVVGWRKKDLKDLDEIT